jgi:dimethylglycine dehydrogenase
MLAESGRLMGDFTLHRMAEQEFLLVGSGYLQTWHGRWFADHIDGNRAIVENLSDAWGGFAIFGPRSRELLANLSSEDLSNDAFPFMSCRRMAVGFAPALVSRLSVTGELGYEIFVSLAHMPVLHALLEQQRRRFDGRWVGYYAVNSLRLEKGFGIWSREFSRDYTPRMAGLDRFIAYDKGKFIGRAAALQDQGGASRMLVLLEVDAADADVAGFEPVYLDQALAGFTSSGAFGHCVGKSLAMGYVTPAARASAGPLTVWIMGEARAARILDRAPFDPDGLRMRG